MKEERNKAGERRKKAGNLFLNLLYPRRCPVCHEIAAPRGQKICTKCREKLKPIQGARCYQCSKPLTDPGEEYCRDCRQIKHHFKKGIGIFAYQEVLQSSLFQLKYGQRQEYGTFYGELAAYYAKEVIFSWKIQVLIPVPLHRKKQEKRGYNQAELIARALGKTLGIPVDSKYLYRSKETMPQKELNAVKRRQNMQGAFAVKGKREYKRILLVDDIYTTGSTLDSCAKCLLLAGAEEVFFLTIAIGRGA